MIELALLLASLASHPAAAREDGVVETVNSGLDSAKMSTADPCKRIGAISQILGKGGEFSTQDDSCYNSRLVPPKAQMPANPCDNLHAYLCGPREDYDDRRKKDLQSFQTTFNQSFGLDSAAIDLWISEHAPPNDRITPKPKLPGRPPLTVTTGFLPTTIGGHKLTTLADLTTAKIEEMSKGDTALHERLEVFRNAIVYGDGNKTKGADAARCRSGSIPVDTQERIDECAEAYRMEAVAKQVHALTVDVGFGTRPRAGDPVPPSIAALHVPDAWARTLRVFNETKARIIARISDPSKSANLTASQRALALRIVSDVNIVPPEGFKTASGLAAWESMCAGGMNAAEDDEMGYVATSGPPLNGDGKYHRHGMIICPATVVNASDAWLTSVIAHEIGHSIDPGALSRLSERYLAPEFQQDTQQSQADRDFYRDLGAAPAGSSGQAEVRGLLQSLYGIVSPSGDTYRWDSGQWVRTAQGVAGNDPSSSIGGCYSSFSKCPIQEWKDGGKVLTRTSNPGRCDLCFQLEPGQIEEIEADEVAARELADDIASRPADQKTPAAIRTFLQGALDLHCYGGDPGADGHPAGPARLNRIFASNPEFRAALGCSPKPVTGQGSYQLPCGAGWSSPLAPPRATCNPVGKIEDFSNSCPVQ